MRLVLSSLALFSLAALGSAQTVYSGALTTTDPTFNRPDRADPDLSAVGTNVFYDVQPFFVSSAGSYTFSSVQSYDGFILLYQGAFLPSSALTNLLARNDDSGANTSSLTFSLAPGTQYFAVTTAFGNGDTGTYVNTLAGPGVATLGSVQAVPEPVTMALGACAFGVALKRRRKA